MSLTEYNRLVQAISVYKLAVDEAHADLRRPFILDLVFIVFIPVALTVVAGVFSNVAGLLTTLGLGGINAEERFRRGQTVLKSYWGECSKLNKSLRRLEFELQLCKPTNTAGLQKIEKRLKAYFDALETLP